jgi:ATP-dependent Clp protease protease subunit
MDKLAPAVVEIPDITNHHYNLISGEINENSSNECIKFILARNLMNKLPPCMKFIINSHGGSVTAGFSIIDTMKGSKIPIYTYGLGQIASTGLMIFIAGQKGHRFITKNTSILSHQYTWGSFGKHHELFSQVKEYDNTHNRIVEHYKKCTGMNEKEIKKYLLPAEDVWLTAQEAVKLGLADSIVDFY